MAATKSDKGGHGGNRRNSGRTFRPPMPPFIWGFVHVMYERFDRFRGNTFDSMIIIPSVWFWITVALTKCLSIVCFPSFCRCQLPLF